MTQTDKSSKSAETPQKQGARQKKPANNDLLITAGEASAVLQRAVSHCMNAGLGVRYAMMDGTLWLAIDGLLPKTLDNGEVVFVATPPAVNGRQYIDEELNLD